MRKQEAKPIDVEKLKSRIRIIVVKDMMDFWIVLCSCDLAKKFEESANANGENLYPWPQGSEHGVTRLARVDFQWGYCFPEQKDELFAIANAEADRIRQAMGVEKDQSFVGDSI